MSVPCHEGPPATRGHFCSEPAVAGGGRYYCSCNSEAMNVVCGVPQGSILGPKLFILYVNDICNVSSLLRFADDTNIFDQVMMLRRLVRHYPNN